MQNDYWNTFDGSSMNFYDELNIFKLDFEEYISICSTNILSDTEVGTMERLYKQQDRESYLVRKYVLRVLLSICLQIDPKTIIFCKKANKKPTVKGLHFNTSKSDGCIVIAIGPSPIGVDVEMASSNIDLILLVTQCFSKNEALAFQNSDDSVRTFYEIWTRKEALLKATGEGLVEDLKSVSVLNSIVERQNDYFKLSTHVNNNCVLTICNYLRDRSKVKFWNKIGLEVFATF